MTVHEIFKEYFIPLLSPAVAIVVPTIVLYLIPRRWARHNLTLDLFDTFFSEDMRRARLVAWSAFVSPGDAAADARRDQNFARFRAFLTEPEAGRKIDEATHELFQKTSRVLDFFAIVDGCIARGSVDEKMIRSFLAYYWHWWREMVLDPLRSAPLPPHVDAEHLPIWWRGLPHLERACMRPRRAAAGRTTT